MAFHTKLVGKQTKLWATGKVDYQRSLRSVWGNSATNRRKIGPVYTMYQVILTSNVSMSTFWVIWCTFSISPCNSEAVARRANLVGI